ncbi:hypothetical protein JOC86_000126 [Bacillus pakistanensis]|uniref:DUF5316 domain-containing protein n=1 Tax=Rossellomorea pakistanensis TaxID=992288 RepID=A0ABS2N6Z7_9BACI|nr:DUF5316 domain-containing protein [Bacillus pakistanensis]MBM7583589.1 hypothetical protein [Bacillus pakistanensis]
MKRAFFVGTLVAVIFFICGYFTELELFTLASGGLGLVSLLISGLLSGVFISGDQIRANAAIENRDEGKKRKRGMYVFALIGAPNLIVAILLTILS